MNDGRSLIRARMSVRRNDLGAKQRIEAAAGLLHSLEALPEFLIDRRVAGYWAVRGELPLNLVVAALRRRGQHYFLPILGTARHLRFGEYAEGTPLDNNRVGIPEPVVDAGARLEARALDVILMPLLAFDAAGNRLGTGGGWYDTSLAFLRAGPRPARPLLVGVGYGFQQVDHVPAEAWDVPLDYVATEETLLACGNTHATA
jgi:5-formyltetrahydrofolate cyclo-ligase